jgi:hypothetical protein
MALSSSFLATVRIGCRPEDITLSGLSGMSHVSNTYPAKATPLQRDEPARSVRNATETRQT